MEPERPWTLETAVAETRIEVVTLRRDVDALRAEVRADIGELRTEVRAEIGVLRQDFRRLDDRFFQLLLLQLGTLVAALASVVTAILT